MNPFRFVIFAALVLTSFSTNDVASAAQAHSPAMKQFIHGATQKFLAKKYQDSSDQVAEAILEASKKYKFDPIFLMAVIQNESSFNPGQKGGLDEVGLMQLRPKSAKWIAKKYGIPFKDEKTLLDPGKNIKIGTALLDKLRKQFNSKGQLFLAAYNMGEGNIKKYVKNKKYPREYVRAVMTRYLALCLAYASQTSPQKKGSVALKNIQKLSQKRL